MSLAFLTPATGPAAPPAESPFASAMEADGAVFEVRHGWRVATRFAQPRAEELACEQAVGWADASDVGKLELQVAGGGEAELAALAGGLKLGTAVRSRGAWWCLVTPVRALVLCDPGRTAAIREELEASDGSLNVLDVTAQFLGLRLRGPEARETFARFCALDLRPKSAPVHAFIPGSVARTPGYVVREAEDQYLILTGAATALYLWEVVGDAGRRLGGRPVGTEALGAPATPVEEAGTHA